MFEDMSSTHKKIIADIIYWAISKDKVTISNVVKEFNTSIPVADSCMSVLMKLGIAAKIEDIPEYYIIATEIDDLMPEVKDLLINTGYDIPKIITAFNGLPRDKKISSSNILSDSKHKWLPFGRVKPRLGEKVAIRLTDESKVYMESRTEIVYSEDIKVASWDGFNWTIEPPFPKYDYSPLTSKESVNDGAIVTHWAKLENGELEGWHSRFNPINKYKKLLLEIDDEHEEDVYRALLLASSCIMKAANELPKDNPTKSKLLKAHSIMYDLQSSIDHGIILNSEEG